MTKQSFLKLRIILISIQSLLLQKRIGPPKVNLNGYIEINHGIRPVYVSKRFKSPENEKPAILEKEKLNLIKNQLKNITKIYKPQKVLPKQYAFLLTNRKDLGIILLNAMI